MTNFNELGLSKDALTAVAKLGYETPTPVQEQAIPVVLERRDLIAAASTGTGKTAAFLLPLLSNLERGGRGRRAPRVLVVTPTRELAQQIASTCIKIARATGHFATTVYGGTPYGPQIREIKGGTDILIATPGRLCDLMERSVVDLSRIEALVLDEADRMLDMGFLPAVTTIVEALPAERQTLLFSATIDESIKSNLGSLLRDPAVVQIAHKGETAATVDQYIIPVAYKEKSELLKCVLDEKGHERVIVFARTKIRAEELAEELCQAGYTAESIHSDKKQGARRRALDGFRKGRTDVLVATDVLARGIDVPSVNYVVNYDLPDMSEDYVHRIGRTGRAGEVGYAISFVTPNTRRLLREIQELIGREIPIMELESYDVDPSILKGGKKKRTQPKRKVDGGVRHKERTEALEQAMRKNEEAAPVLKNREQRRREKFADSKFANHKNRERKNGGRDDRERGKGRVDQGERSYTRGKKRYEQADERKGRDTREKREGRNARNTREEREDRRSRRGAGRSQGAANHRKGASARSQDKRDKRAAAKSAKGKARPANDIRSFGERKLKEKAAKKYTRVK